MGTYKKLGWEAADVRCPFYVSDDRDERSICCEGYEKGVDTISRFRNLMLRERHMGNYCVGKFEKCPVYRCTYGCRYAD